MNWIDVLEPILASSEYSDLRDFDVLRRLEVPVYPEKSKVLRALQETPLESVKVVIVGQDPYHGPGQANGLAFSINKGLPRPPALRNIIIELQNDLYKEVDPNANTLLGWARQGVLLLNTSLTVEHGQPGSHAAKWGFFTDAIIKAVAARSEPAVALLWGNQAKAKKHLLGNQVLPLEAGHPSPFSVAKFFGCKHFSQTNQKLKEWGLAPIDWTKIDVEG